MNEIKTLVSRLERKKAQLDKALSEKRQIELEIARKLHKLRAESVIVGGKIISVDDAPVIAIQNASQIPEHLKIQINVLDNERIVEEHKKGNDIPGVAIQYHTSINVSDLEEAVA